MKKIMGLMLGLSLVLGSVSIAFAQTDTTNTSKKKMNKKKGKKKGSTTTPSN